MARIQKEVAPTSWGVTEDFATMVYDAKTFSLTVRQTEAAHKQIANLLKELERGQIAIEMRIVNCSEKSVEKLGNLAPNWTTKEGITYSFIDLQRYYRLLDGLQADPTTNCMQFPKITMFEGQTGHISLEDQINLKLVPSLSKDKRLITVKTQLRLKASPDEKDSSKELSLDAVTKLRDQQTIAFLLGTVPAEIKPDTFTAFTRFISTDRMLGKQKKLFENRYIIAVMTPRLIDEEESTFEVRSLKGKLESVEDGKFPPLTPPKAK